MTFPGAKGSVMKDMSQGALHAVDFSGDFILYP